MKLTTTKLKRNKAVTVSLLAVLTAIPTALGYVLGPMTHFINLSFKLIGVPFSLKLGFASIVLVTILARAYLGRGAAVVEGLLLGITAIFFHTSEPPIIRVPKDTLLGIGVDVALLKSENIGMKSAIVASFLGGILSYIPYLMFAPSVLLFFTLLLVTTSGYLISCVIGGFLASLILKLFPPRYMQK